MRYHVSKDGSYTRCIATKRPGQLVTGCPIGASAHVDGRHGIAAAGGGIESRWDYGKRVRNVISGLRDDDTYTTTSGSGRIAVFLANGARLKRRDRENAVRGLSATVETVPLRTLENTPRLLRDAFDPQGKYLNGVTEPRGTFDFLAAMNLLRDFEYPGFVWRPATPSGKWRRDDLPPKEFDALSDSIAYVGSRGFVLEKWMTDPRRAIFEKHFPNALAQIEEDYEVMNLIDGLD